MNIDYNSMAFTTTLLSAQEGDPKCLQLVVLATLPVVWSLRPNNDEAQDLIVHIMEYVVPRWSASRPWALHATVCLSSKLKTLRRTRSRRRQRGLGWL